MVLFLAVAAGAVVVFYRRPSREYAISLTDRVRFEVQMYAIRQAIDVYSEGNRGMLPPGLDTLVADGSLRDEDSFVRVYDGKIASTRPVFYSPSGLANEADGVIVKMTLFLDDGREHALLLDRSGRMSWRLGEDREKKAITLWYRDGKPEGPIRGGSSFAETDAMYPGYGILSRRVPASGATDVELIRGVVHYARLLYRDAYLAGTLQHVGPNAQGIESVVPFRIEFVCMILMQTKEPHYYCAAILPARAVFDSGSDDDIRVSKDDLQYGDIYAEVDLGDGATKGRYPVIERHMRQRGLVPTSQLTAADLADPRSSENADAFMKARRAAVERSKSRQSPFDQGAWQAAVTAGVTPPLDNPRMAMVADLMQHHLRAGMTEEEVRSLLGPPDPQVTRPNQLAYHVGGRMKVITSEETFLVLSFDSTRLLSAWRLNTLP
jgi:hypothetical protein